VPRDPVNSTKTRSNRPEDVLIIPYNVDSCSVYTRKNTWRSSCIHSKQVDLQGSGQTPEMSVLKCILHRCRP